MNLPHSQAAKEIIIETTNERIIVGLKKRIGINNANKTTAVIMRVLSIFGDSFF
jgi:hypothetical protein